MFKIRDKMLVAFLPVLIVPMCIVVALFCFYTISYMKENREDEITQQTRKKKDKVMQHLCSGEKDVLLLSKNRAIFNLTDAVDRKDIEHIDYCRTVVEDLFKDFFESNRNYCQIRYIDESGMEIVRVEMDSIAPPGRLQDKSQSYYVQEMLKLKDGDVYVSELDLNRERGIIETPHRPMIRYAAPVFNSSGRGRGGVVLNSRADSQLFPALKQEFHEKSDTFLIDRDGSYLIHPDGAKCWGGQSDLNTNENLKNDFSPEISSLLLSGESGDVLVNDQYYSYMPISFDQSDIGRFWVLAVSLPKAALYSPVYISCIQLGTSVLLMLAVVITAFFLLSRRVTKPLNELVKGVIKLTETDSDFHIPITSNDEIAFLCFSFNKVLYKLGKANNQLQDYAEHLEKKIEIKTEEIFGKARQQKLVAEIGKLLWSNMNLEVTMHRVVKLVAKTLRMEFCNILLLDKSQPVFTMASGVGGEDGLDGHTQVSAGVETHAGYTLKEQKPVVVRDLRTETRFSDSPLLRERGVVSGLSVAMVVKGKAIGVVVGYTKKERVFSKSDINFLESVGQIMAAAIDRKNAEYEIVRRKEFTDKLIETAQDAIVCIDENGIITIWNKAAEVIFGYSHEEIIGQQILTIIPEKYKEDHKKGLKLFLETNETRITGKTVEVDGRKKNGEEIPIDVSLSYQKVDNGKYIFTAIIRDISFQKEVKRRLRENARSLKKVNRELGDFVYIVSHDLKEPLFAIDGYVSRLSKICGDSLDERGKRYIDRIKVNTKVMSNRIHELLEVIKVGMVVYNFADHKSKIIVDTIAHELESLLDRERIELFIQDDLPTVFCDPKRLKDVFWNLLTNAIKFMGENDTRKIKIGCERENGHYKFFVEDSGIGIKEEYQKQIFKIFRRLKDIDAEGTGIGLAIVKKIIGLHHGKLWVESPIHDGRGAKFCFTIPTANEY
ncbi:MAG: PAS domain S-box protein [Candidatus Scalindua sp.]|nr:PAS domain S-box protein [Candidatus Scalindua sp.]